MLGRLWPRLALEACFLIVVAIVAGLLDLSVVAIFVVMAVAYAATVLLEWTTSRVRSAPKPAAEPAAPAPALEAPGVVAVTVHPSESAWEREEDEVEEARAGARAGTGSPSQSQSPNPNRARAGAGARTGARAGAGARTGAGT